MDDVKAPVAEPSAAATVYDGWDAKGTPIVKKSQPEKQVSAPADAPKGEESEGKPESAAESEAAKPQPDKSKGKPNAEERIRQLTARNKEIERELEAERERSRKEAPKPTPEPKPQSLTRPKPTTEDKNDKGEPKYASFEDYLEDLSDWKTEQKFAERERRQQMEALNARVQSEIEQAEKNYPDFKEKFDPVVKTLQTDESIPAPFKEAVGRSEVFAHLVYALSEEQATKLIELSKTDTVSAIKKLGALEAAVQAELSKSKDAKEAKPESAERPAEPKPRAPKPPSEVGGRGAVPEDGLVSAARTGDFKSFDREMTRRFTAAKH